MLLTSKMDQLLALKSIHTASGVCVPRGWQSRTCLSMEAPGTLPCSPAAADAQCSQTWQPIALLGAQTDKAKADAKNAKNPSKPAPPPASEASDTTGADQGAAGDINKTENKTGGNEEELELDMPLISGPGAEVLLRAFVRRRYNRQVVEHPNGEEVTHG